MAKVYIFAGESPLCVLVDIMPDDQEYDSFWHFPVVNELDLGTLSL